MISRVTEDGLMTGVVISKSELEFQTDLREGVFKNRSLIFKA